MAIAVGDKIPAAKVRVKDDNGINEVSTDELFGGKKVALFAVPGAFTPTCSAKHLPGFIQNADALKAKGIDSIVCVSVNDAFVMDAWGKAQGATGKVVMAADGNGDFTKAMGMELDGSGFLLRIYSLNTRSNECIRLFNDRSFLCFGYIIAVLL